MAFEVAVNSKEEPVIIPVRQLDAFVFLDVASKSLHAGYDYEGGAENVFLPSNVLELNKWYHVLFTRNTLNTTLNCQLHNATRQLLSSKSATYSPSHIPKTNTNPVNIGGFTGGSNVQFDGYIDEVRISNVVRTFISTGINDVNNDPIFSVCPNPTNGIIHLNISKMISNGLIRITNINGQEVYNQKKNDITDAVLLLIPEGIIKDTPDPGAELHALGPVLQPLR